MHDSQLITPVAAAAILGGFLAATTAFTGRALPRPIHLKLNTRWATHDGMMNTMDKSAPIT
jgi:hypothetical protein